MKIELKEGIFIVGCNSLFDLRQSLFPKNGVIPFDAEIIYDGKTSEITRDDVEDHIVADKGAYLLLYRNYKDGFPLFKTVQESIQSACPEEYCIIYKTK